MLKQLILRNQMSVDESDWNRVIGGIHALFGKNKSPTDDFAAVEIYALAQNKRPQVKANFQGRLRELGLIDNSGSIDSTAQEIILAYVENHKEGGGFILRPLVTKPKSVLPPPPPKDESKPDLKAV